MQHKKKEFKLFKIGMLRDVLANIMSYLLVNDSWNKLCLLKDAHTAGSPHIA